MAAQWARIAWFRGRDCGAPLDDVCNESVEHVLAGGGIQDRHRRFAEGNARHIRDHFVVDRPRPEDDYVIEVRRWDGRAFAPKGFKRMMDLLLRNRKGLERGREYAPGAGPSLQRCPRMRRSHSAPGRLGDPGGTAG